MGKAIRESSIETRLGKSFKLGMFICQPINRIILIRVCGRYQTGRHRNDLENSHGRTNSNNFGWVLELISRFDFEFRRRGNFFLMIRNFRVFGCSITCNVTAHVPVLWPVCTQTIPFRMLLCRGRFMITCFFQNMKTNVLQKDTCERKRKRT